VFAASGERIGRLVDLYANLETSAVVFVGVATIRRGRRRFVLSPTAASEPGSVTDARTHAALDGTS
jgi:hypothetical protein